MLLFLRQFYRFFRPRGKLNNKRRQQPLCVEPLEERECPAVVPLTLDAVVQPAHSVQLSGHYTGSEPSGVTIIFSGAVTGASTITDANGYFSLTTSENVSLGTVFASTLDENQQPTNTTSDVITVDAPTVSLEISVLSGDSLVVIGHTENHDALGAVTFSGILSGTTNIDSNGDFEFDNSVPGPGVLTATVVNEWGLSASAEISVAQLATPTLAAEVLADHQVLLTGSLGGQQYANIVITFSGAVSGTTITDCSGNFSFNATAASQGTVYAVAGAGSALESAAVEPEIAAGAPIVTMSISDVTPNAVTVAGTVSGLDQAGLVVVVAGLLNGRVVTDADGAFSFTGYVSGPGTITATTTDCWGQASNTAEVTVESLPEATSPLISLFTHVLPGRQLQLTGRVIGADGQEVAVTFSGAAAGSTTTDTAGNFSFVTSQASLGTVYALGIDEYEQTTNTAQAAIDLPTPFVTMNIDSVDGELATIAGVVTGVDPGGQTVTLGGSVNTSVQTDSAGKFSFTTNLSALANLTASTTDLWGQTSPSATIDAAHSIDENSSFVTTGEILRYVRWGGAAGTVAAIAGGVYYFNRSASNTVRTSVQAATMTHMLSFPGALAPFSHGSFLFSDNSDVLPGILADQGGAGGSLTSTRNAVSSDFTTRGLTQNFTMENIAVVQYSVVQGDQPTRPGTCNYVVRFYVVARGVSPTAPAGTPPTVERIPAGVLIGEFRDARLESMSLRP